MKKILVLATLFAVALLATPAVHADVEASAVLDQLKSLEGTWTGSAAGEGEAEAKAEGMAEVVHRFEVSAGGTVVMETMSPDSAFEMINMYHVDGDDLVLTHYCAGGNQPRMRLDRAGSSSSNLVFDFDGGTNLDPAVDNHIHSANIRMLEDGSLDSIWHGYSSGEKAGEMAVHLTRSNAAE